MFDHINFSYLFWPFLALFACLGLFAFVCPNRFRQFAFRSSKWVDTDKVVAAMDQRIEIDQYVLRHCRLLGAVVMLAAALLAHLYVTY